MGTLDVGALMQIAVLACAFYYIFVFFSGGTALRRAAFDTTSRPAQA